MDTRKTEKTHRDEKLTTSQKISFIIHRLEKFVIPQCFEMSKGANVLAKKSSQPEHSGKVYFSAEQEEIQFKSKQEESQVTLGKEEARTIKQKNLQPVLEEEEFELVSEAEEIQSTMEQISSRSADRRSHLQNSRRFILQCAQKPLYTVDISVLKHWINEKPLSTFMLRKIKHQWLSDSWNGLYDPPAWLTAEMFSIALMDLDSNNLKRDKFATASENLKIARLISSSHRSGKINSSLKEKSLDDVLQKLYNDYQYSVQMSLKGLFSKFENLKSVYVMKVEVNEDGKILEETADQVLKDINYGIMYKGDWKKFQEKYYGARLANL